MCLIPWTRDRGSEQVRCQRKPVVIYIIKNQDLFTYNAVTERDTQFLKDFPTHGTGTICPRMLLPCTFHSRTIRPCLLILSVFTSPYVSSLKCRDHIQG